MKYIFLDFDGVLNTEKHQEFLRSYNQKTFDSYGPLFDPSAVECLSSIVTNVSDARIVIISSWKFEGLDKMQNLWKDRSLPGILAGISPNLIPESIEDLYAGKGREVREWIAKNPCSGYVILDDVPDFLPEQHDHYIEINPKVGLTPHIVKQAISILNNI
jgi:hypothetical protein